VIEVNRPVACSGKPFQKRIEQDIATPIFGLPIRQSFQRSSIQQWGRKQVRQRVLERWNNTLRQRLARFVRKTLSFSKSLVMHDVCLRLFLHRYNLERAAMLM
jgi:hypothetical protein